MPESDFHKQLDQRWLPAQFTASNGMVPAFAVLEITDSDLPGGLSRHSRQILRVRKPSSGTASRSHCINGPSRIFPNGSVTMDYPTYALYEENDGTPIVGEIWGPQADSYKLRKGARGFRILGGETGTGEDAKVRVEREGAPAHPYDAAFRVSLTEIAAGGIVTSMANTYRDPDNVGSSTGVFWGSEGLEFEKSGSYLVGFSGSLYSNTAPRGTLLSMGLYLGVPGATGDDLHATQYTVVRTQDIEVDQYGAAILTTLENVANSGPLQIRAGQTLTLRNTTSTYAVIFTPATFFAVLLSPHSVAVTNTGAG